MNFEDLIELIYFEFVLEGLGVLFGFLLLWQVFFKQGLPSLISLFITTLC